MKIFLADPHPQVRSALHLVLSQIPRVSVIGESGDGIQLLAQCSQECPDLILLDLGLVKRSARQPLVDIITVIHRICPGAKVVVMSSRLEVEREVRSTGADGFISKTEQPEIFCEQIARLLDKKERRSSK
jgi:DNA-binding NarL/FixJ family response regulator